jgi:uncharacterized protein YprB with RNaseH-like and TPR domain
MLHNIDISNVLFLDIETVPQEPAFEELDMELKVLWEHKTHYTRHRDNQTLDESYEKAGIFAEFGKIVCISVGIVRIIEGKRVFRTKSYFGDDEAQILSDFSDLLRNHYNQEQYMLCAHNGKEFDFPYIARRLLINNMKLPYLLDIAGKKPWEVHHLDTMQLWKFGDYKHYTSVNLLAKIFNIPTPKDDIDGSQVREVYWKDRDLDRIEQYCRKDVLTVAQIFLRFRGEAILAEEEVVAV